MVLRITTLGAGIIGVPKCNECKNLVEEGENITRRKSDTMDNGTKNKMKVPGLDHRAVEKSTDDKNLAPLSLTSSKTIQYGNTSIESCSTDHPDWAAGKCQNLEKYSAFYRVKCSRITQQVTLTV